MSQQRSAANAVSGRTARACDSCLRRRARWYCTADDAFLCQPCDSLVHSANALARRHDRVRLKTSSSTSFVSPPPSDLDSALPGWHQGFKRKARTPRHAKGSTAALPKPVLLVPDLESNVDNNVDEDGAEVHEVEEEEEEEEQLLYCVPIFDPVLAEFCSPPAAFDETNMGIEEAKPALTQLSLPAENQSHSLTVFNPSDVELAEFAADVENLLGQGLEDDSFNIYGLGLLETREIDNKSSVKMELLDSIDTSGDIVGNTTNFLEDMEMEFSRESLDFNFDCGSPAVEGEEPEEQKAEETAENCDGLKRMTVGLKLDYEAVIAGWSCQGRSPWTDGERPQFNLDDCWPDFMDVWGSGGEFQGSYGEIQMGGHAGINGDGGREARVSRYREKRRTRLFSKKIRYEVRKLNAEKRPRMKGRFVKRTSFAPPPVAAGGGAACFPYG